MKWDCVSRWVARNLQGRRYDCWLIVSNPHILKLEIRFIAKVKRNANTSSMYGELIGIYPLEKYTSAELRFSRVISKPNDEYWHEIALVEALLLFRLWKVYFEVFINCLEVKREHDNVKKEKRIPFNASRRMLSQLDFAYNKIFRRSDINFWPVSLGRLDAGTNRRIFVCSLLLYNVGEYVRRHKYKIWLIKAYSSKS